MDSEWVTRFPVSPNCRTVCWLVLLVGVGVGCWCWCWCGHARQTYVRTHIPTCCAESVSLSLKALLFALPVRPVGHTEASCVTSRAGKAHSFSLSHCDDFAFASIYLRRKKMTDTFVVDAPSAPALPAPFARCRPLPSL